MTLWKKALAAVSSVVTLAVLAITVPAVLDATTPLADCPNLKGAAPDMRPNGYYAEDHSWSRACYMAKEYAARAAEPFIG